MGGAIGNNLLDLDQNYSRLIGEQFFDFTIVVD
jgi:pantothenate kinase